MKLHHKVFKNWGHANRMSFLVSEKNLNHIFVVKNKDSTGTWRGEEKHRLVPNTLSHFWFEMFVNLVQLHFLQFFFIGLKRWDLTKKWGTTSVKWSIMRKLWNETVALAYVESGSYLNRKPGTLFLKLSLKFFFSFHKIFGR